MGPALRRELREGDLVARREVEEEAAVREDHEAQRRPRVEVAAEPLCLHPAEFEAEGRNEPCAGGRRARRRASSRRRTSRRRSPGSRGRDRRGHRPRPGTGPQRSLLWLQACTTTFEAEPVGGASRRPRCIVEAAQLGDELPFPVTPRVPEELSKAIAEDLRSPPASPARRPPSGGSDRPPPRASRDCAEATAERRPARGRPRGRSRSGAAILGGDRAEAAALPAEHRPREGRPQDPRPLGRSRRPRCSGGGRAARSSCGRRPY